MLNRGKNHIAIAQWKPKLLLFDSSVEKYMPYRGKNGQKRTLVKKS